MYRNLIHTDMALRQKWDIRTYPMSIFGRFKMMHSSGRELGTDEMEEESEKICSHVPR